MQEIDREQAEKILADAVNQGIITKKTRYFYEDGELIEIEEELSTRTATEAAIALLEHHFGYESGY